MTEKTAQLSHQQKQQMKEHLKRTYGPEAIVSKRALSHKVNSTFSMPVHRKTKPEAAVHPEPTQQSVACQSDTLSGVKTDLGDCTRCKLSTTRTHIVFGEGNPNATLMFVGEGPGEQEDIQGRPFVGRAGQLLDKIIEAMGFKREDVFIANVVKCRPPGNRRPEPDEVSACEPFLFKQIDIIKPKIVVALGGTALQCLLHSDAKITQMRGKFIDYRGAKLMPTYHPAFLLRNPPAKKDVWDDMKIVMEELKR